MDKRRKVRQRRRAALLMVVCALVCLVWAAKQGYRRVQLALYPQNYSAAVERWAEAYSVDPLLIDAFTRTESGFDPKAESNVGARGLMQITEETFFWIKSKIAPDEALTFDDLYDPETNIRFGSYYVAACLERYQNDVATAAAAYHSGWGTVDRLLAAEGYSDNGVTLRVFPYNQMQNYVAKIQRNYRKYQGLYAASAA